MRIVYVTTNPTPAEPAALPPPVQAFVLAQQNLNQISASSSSKSPQVPEEPATPSLLSNLDPTRQIPESVADAISAAKEIAHDPQDPNCILLDGPVTDKWKKEVLEKLKTADLFKNITNFVLSKDALLLLSKTEVELLKEAIQSGTASDPRSGINITPHALVQEHAVIFKDETMVLSKFTLLRFASAKESTKFEIQFPITDLSKISSSDFFAVLQKHKGGKTSLVDRVETVALPSLNFPEVLPVEKGPIEASFDLLMEVLEAYDQDLLHVRLEDLNLPSSINPNIDEVGHYLIRIFCETLLKSSDEVKLKLLLCYEVALKNKSPALQEKFKNKAVSILQELSDPFDWKMYAVTTKSTFQRLDAPDPFLTEHLEYLIPTIFQNNTKIFLESLPIPTEVEAEAKKQFLFNKLKGPAHLDFLLAFEHLGRLDAIKALAIRFHSNPDETKAHYFLRERLVSNYSFFSEKLLSLAQNNTNKTLLILSELLEISPFLALFHIDFFLQHPLTREFVVQLEEMQNTMGRVHPDAKESLSRCKELMEMPALFLNSARGEKEKEIFFKWLSSYLPLNMTEHALVDFCVWRLPSTEADLKTEILAFAAKTYIDCGTLELAETFARKMKDGEAKTLLLQQIQEPPKEKARPREEDPEPFTRLPKRARQEKKEKPQLAQAESFQASAVSAAVFMQARGAEVAEREKKMKEAFLNGEVKELSIREDSILSSCITGKELFEVLFRDLACIEVTLSLDSDLKKIELFFNWAEQLKLPHCYKIGIAAFYALQYLKKFHNLTDFEKLRVFHETHQQFFGKIEAFGIQLKEIVNIVNNSPENGSEQPRYLKEYVMQWVEEHPTKRDTYLLQPKALYLHKSQIIKALIQRDFLTVETLYQENPYALYTFFGDILFEEGWESEWGPFSLNNSLELISLVLDRIFKSDPARLAAMHFAVPEEKQQELMAKFALDPRPFEAYNSLVKQKVAAILKR